MLFVLGTTTGGSAASTHELAESLITRGHDVGILVRERHRPRIGLVAPTPSGARHLITSLPARAWLAARRRVVRIPGVATARHGVDVWRSPSPERVLPRVVEEFGPHVVVVSSVPRNTWRSIRATLRTAGTPAVLYVRELATLSYVSAPELRADLTLANSRELERAVRESGVPSSYVPSVVDFRRCEVASTREVVLFVNPITSRGLPIAVALAAENPDLTFAFQLSWPLGRRDRRLLSDEIGRHPNIELREHTSEPASVYRDARVLLVPYVVDQRPRVVAEAQHNGIPVLASDLPGHREAVGPGGMLVPLDAPIDEWTAALRAIVEDARASELGTAGRAHARRLDQDGEAIAARFEALMESMVAGDTTR